MRPKYYIIAPTRTGYWLRQRELRAIDTQDAVRLYLRELYGHACVRVVQVTGHLDHGGRLQAWRYDRTATAWVPIGVQFAVVGPVPG